MAGASAHHAGIQIVRHSHSDDDLVSLKKTDWKAALNNVKA